MNWSEMSPRERDALVAEKVFGCKNPAIGWLADKYPDSKTTTIWPNYTTDIKAAWEVVEKMTTGCRFPDFELRFNEFNREWDVDYGNVHIASDTAPQAICLAALKSVGVEI